MIFKEKKYDRLFIIMKELLIIVLLLLLSLLIINYFLDKHNQGYQAELIQLQQEELKYLSLIKKNEENQLAENSAAEKYNLLITLTGCSKEIKLNSLHLKNEKLTLTAESKEQGLILKFVDSLKADHTFTNVNLLRLTQQNGYNFQLETIIR
ncbi:MAG: hypothetical protein CI949_2601 [Halanaerobium sp.]|nr:MAG: hypothetical protein CI949_2601 [Halanaerobium sp.]